MKRQNQTWPSRFTSPILAKRESVEEQLQEGMLAQVHIAQVLQQPHYLLDSDEATLPCSQEAHHRLTRGKRCD